LKHAKSWYGAIESNRALPAPLYAIAFPRNDALVPQGFAATVIGKSFGTTALTAAYCSPRADAKVISASLKNGSSFKTIPTTFGYRESILASATSIEIAAVFVRR
jgi:hypothetical protein